MTRHSQLLLLLQLVVVAAVPHLHQSISASTVCTEGPASTHNTVVRCQCDCERTSKRLETVSMHGEVNTTLAYVNVSLTSLGQYILSRSDRRQERSETIIIIITIVIEILYFRTRPPNLCSHRRCERDFVLIPTHFYHATALQLCAFARHSAS